MDRPASGESERIRAILFKEGDMWVGQCLEYDIGAQAAALDVLHTRLMIALDVERKESIKRHGRPFAGIDAAPKRFHQMWEKASGEYSPRRSSELPGAGAVNLELALCA